MVFFETNSLGERPMVNRWWKRQSEGVTHGWRFGEKILQDRGETVTLEVEIGPVPVRKPIFRAAVKSRYLIPHLDTGVRFCGRSPTLDMETPLITIA